MERIKVIRKVFTNNSTIGDLDFQDFGCWILEPPKRRNGTICIPSGSYKIEWRWSPKHNMFVPGLMDVPGRTDIEIHPGNYPKDTLGCLLPGMNHSVDYVADSKTTCAKFFPLVEEACKNGDVFIDIAG